MNYDKQHLDQYELQQCLRKDTTNEVWKAFDTQQQRYVIIALLRFTLPTEEVLPRFLRETRGLVALHHPNLVPILEVRVLSRTTSALNNSGEAYIVMDYVDGLSLALYLQNQDQTRKMLSPVEIMRILSPIGEAVDYIHQQGIIHSFIRPSSILLDKHSASGSPLGEPRLIDLGMHNTYDPQQLLANDACYIAPEIIQGDTNNVRSDLYSLGIILYEMCTAAVPFHGATTAEVINQQLNAMPPSPALLNASIGPGLTSVIMRALAKDPSGRFPSASAMISALAKALQMPTPQASGQSGVDRIRDEAMYNPTFLSSPSQQIYQQNRPFPADGQGTPASLPYVAQAPVSDSSTGPTMVSPISAIHQPISNHSTPISDTQNTSFVSGSFQNAVDRRPYGQVKPTPTSGFSGSMSTLVGSVPPARKPKSRGLYVSLIILAVLVLVSASVGTWFLFSHSAAPQKTIIGHAFFVSSGMMSLTSSSGITDGLQLRLENISSPQSGKSYYVWLLPDADNKADAVPLALGMLAVQNNQARLNYAGDANHTNLLSQYSRLLVTEEDTNSQPVNPSLNSTDWRYSAAFSHVPDPQDTENHFSLVDHLRHLLSQDPKLQKVGLVGGLSSWLYRDTLKILEWTGSARDLALTNDNPTLVRKQLVRILDYLDSSQFVQTENLPPDLAATPILADPTIARVGLLEISPAQQPPGYLKHIGTHLSDITRVPGVSPTQKQLASKINDDINDVQVWLIGVHKDAAELLQKPADQVIQPQTLPVFDDMFAQANKAFTGQTDPHTGQVKAGVAQIYYNIQNLATFDITACKGSNTGNTCVGGPF